MTERICAALLEPQMPAASDRCWTPGPAHPHLAANTLHLWRADLEAVGDDVVELLSAEEHARAEAIVHERKRRRWTRSRGVLRALIGRYTGQHPETLRFSSGADGKPELVEEADQSAPAQPHSSASSPGLSFNVSHSGPLALYAFNEAGPVGVDVELARGPIDEVALAARAFGAGEARRLEHLGPAARRRAFLRDWVRHEARLKCLGTGIRGDPTGASTREPWIVELEDRARRRGCRRNRASSTRAALLGLADLAQGS